MPFWKQPSPEDQQRLQQQQQDAEASQRSLEAGGIPVQAQRRLREENHKLFTSDLSVNEFLLTRNEGYDALSQVMGSSIYHVGWQYTYNYTYNTVAMELTTISNAHQHSAMLALRRLEEEATLLGADGVIGVRLSTRGYDWGANLIEYTAIGTAIRLHNKPTNAPTNKRPFLSDLSGQEFWILLQSGYYPTGIVTGYCSYNISLGSYMTSMMRGWGGFGGYGAGYNQEITAFSQGIYTARGIAMSRLIDLAKKLNASGVVGMHVDCVREPREYETDNPTRYYLDLAVHFSAVGTSIAAVKRDHVIPSPRPTLTMTDLRPGSYGETSELTFRE